ncbi:AAA family ATPase [Psychroserpens luteus]|uniref:AAA family ATPase n=1 Tax=Psychroserpens luteus TaxID=1434066 RepID=A0ABW5ZV32_9FLAO|nr:AAA family ATPase [Psychroserpens luteus]
MKFKKVEIQGFRAYGDKEDATFDFTENNEVVDFISIYAPNGFGKTSFYDAIEWSVTHKIKRIESALSNYDLIKTEKEANREGNKLSDALQVISKIGYNNPEKFVNIETTTKPFNRKIKPSNRKGTADYDQTTKLKNPNFRDVILSQEGINSFLVAEKPEDRYKNFVQHFDSHDLDRLYRNLVVLRKENEKRSKVLQSDRAKINKQLNKKIDIEVSEKINQLISDLDGLEIKLDKISQEFDLSDLAIFKSDITGVRNEFELGESSIIEKLKKERNLLTQVQQNTPKYISDVEQKGKLLKLIDNLSKLIKDFGDLSKKSNRKDKLIKSLKQVKTQKDDFKTLSDKLPEFKKISERLEQIKKNKEQKDHYLIKLNNLETLINLNSTTFRNRQLSFEEKIIKIEQNSNVQKSNLKNYKNSLKEISNLEIKLKPQKQNFKDENNLLNELKKEIEELLLIEKNSKSKIYENNKSKLISKDSIDELKNKKVLIVNKEKEISIAKKKLNDSKSLQENLNYLIELGSKIIDNTKQSNCPLCKNEYGKYKNLLEKININNLLVESSKENTFKITHLESELKELKEKFDKNADSLVSLIRTKIEELQLKINNSTNKIETLDKDISSLEKDLEKHKSIIEDHNREYQKIDLEKRFVVIQQEIKTFKDRINIYENNIEKYNLWSNRIKEKKSKSKLGLFDLDRDLKNLLNDPLYKNYKDLLNLYDLDSNKQRIELKLKSSKKEFENLDKEILNLDKEINILKDKLKEFKIEELKLQESSFQKDLLKLNSFESEFNKLIQNLGISTKDIEKDLNSKIISNEVMIAKNEAVIRELSKIEKLIEPLGEFINYKDLKSNEKGLIKSIKLNKKIESDLKNELNNISNRIKSMIKEFFFDDLINKIYNKIDPHPLYRKINFKVDFSDYGFPKLNIFTDDGKGSGNKVPNLYFSSAQMNILSLSIFLAKALHAVDQDNNPIDTIFIDDPVQAMDSINVLSVIDLLRNIITNHKKQIIISTHDENFFNLLKKKIPKNYFKSKFLELETFGKLKREENLNIISNISIKETKKNSDDSNEMLMS